MKVLFVIAATVSCFGLALQHDTTAPVSQENVSRPAVMAEVEAPVMDVLLDTVVITAVAPQAVAANIR
ncbi:hypothetical protein [Pontibacter roseus]|uniref:hypothetical protein n=1 Tax=Pontibacter roseus TaxID=336989 RepID=UPI00038066FA|nr:hypothetical protein [Pontibacter roseus]